MARYAARGIFLKIGDGGGGGEVFTTLGQVISFRGPSRRRETVDSSDHDTQGFREFLATLIDSGEVSGTVHYDPDLATHEQMEDDFNAGTLRNFQVDYSGKGITLGPAAFAAIVTQWEADHPSDGKLTADFTLKVSGAVTGLT